MLKTYLLSVLFFFAMADPLTIYDFTSDSSPNEWRVVDDGVMGGRSDGNFYINEEGHGVFTGKVSLENNGGFSSIRHRFKTVNTEGYEQVSIRLRGDGKRYQFRVKSRSSDYYSYITYFETSGEWQTVELELSEMYASFRGMRLDLPNYPDSSMEEISFLIGNKKAEEFKLLIDKIELK